MPDTIEPIPFSKEPGVPKPGASRPKKPWLPPLLFLLFMGLVVAGYYVYIQPDKAVPAPVQEPDPPQEEPPLEETTETVALQTNTSPSRPKETPLEQSSLNISIQSTPPGAAVLLNQRFSGYTPLNLTLPPANYTLLLQKKGYGSVTDTLQISTTGTLQFTYALTANKGTIRVVSHPPGAQIMLDNDIVGTAPLRIESEVKMVELIAQLEGYTTATQEVNVIGGATLRTDFTLTKKVLKPAAASKAPPTLTVLGSYLLNKVQPQPFTMGSSRREPGRRSNERYREVVLKRPFYMGTTELTLSEYQQYKPDHNNGTFRGKTLNKPTYPVVNITWEEAVAFCNWLSRQEQLPEAYIKTDEGWTSVSPLNHGYRLPTEAEWEYVAKYSGNSATHRFPWGETFPPKNNTANLADAFSRRYLSVFIPDYTDQAELLAPIKTYPPNKLGLYDLAGNVSEWCHDGYVIRVPNQGVDPAGPSGISSLHVIKGSNWRSASFTQLRCAYREADTTSRIDLGFRIVRYIDP